MGAPTGNVCEGAAADFTSLLGGTFQKALLQRAKLLQWNIEGEGAVHMWGQDHREPEGRLAGALA